MKRLSIAERHDTGSDVENPGGIAEGKPQKAMKDFNPLDSYSDWVVVPYQTLQEELRSVISHEVRAVLQEQIDAAVPNCWLYRKCIMFKETLQTDTLARQFSWLYRPNRRIIEAELGKSIRRLAK